MFCLAGEKVNLLPLTIEGIDDRIIWNTKEIVWKKEENLFFTSDTFDVDSYRAKKVNEIENNLKFIDGVYNSLEIYLKTGQHVGFINFYPIKQSCALLPPIAVGIIIPKNTFRAHGLGTDSLNVYTKYLVDSGYKEIYIYTYPNNHAMIKSALKSGYVQVGEPSIKDSRIIMKFFKSNIPRRSD